MAINRKDRRRTRQENCRHQELGYYLILADTEKTEKNYFEGLKDALPDDKRKHITIRVEQCQRQENIHAAWTNPCIEVWMVLCVFC